MDEDDINRVNLPDEVSREGGSYYKIIYEYKIYHGTWNYNFNLITYIPFEPFTNAELYNIGEKGVSLRSYSRYNGSQSTGRSASWQLTPEEDITDEKIIDIHEIQKYITTNLTTTCSTCDSYNRGWVCCGQFAPYMFIYHYFLYEQDVDFRVFYSRLGGVQDVMKRQLYRMAVAFYKTFTGYGAFDLPYMQVQDSIPIPNIHRNPSYWLDYLHNNELVENKGYLYVLYDVSYPNTIYHFGFIYRVDDYVIICDSWTHDYGSRPPVTRTIDYNDYLDIVNNINRLCNQIQNNSYTEEQKTELLIMYNYMMNSLFIIPYNYNETYIHDDTLTFPENKLAKFHIVNPARIDRVINDLIRNNHLFDAYVALGGYKNKKKNTKPTKKRTNKKRKTHRKKLTN